VCVRESFHAFVLVCICICTVCVVCFSCVHVCLCTHTHTHPQTHTHTHTCRRVCTHTHTHTNTRVGSRRSVVPGYSPSPFVCVNLCANVPASLSVTCKLHLVLSVLIHCMHASTRNTSNRKPTHKHLHTRKHMLAHAHPCTLSYVQVQPLLRTASAVSCY